MSAFEVVGVVLAVLPLVWEGLDAYPDSRVAKFLRANQERAEFGRQLLCAQSGLRSAMMNLFKEIEAELTPAQKLAITSLDVKGSKFFEIWKEIVAAHPKMTFDCTLLGQIRVVVDDLSDVLTQVVKHAAMPRYAETDVLRRVIENHSRDEKFSLTKDFYHRFMFAKSDRRRTKLISRMELNIKTLTHLVKEMEVMKTISVPENPMEADECHAVYCDTVRGYCNNLYHASSLIWKCECHKSPSAMLRLERRTRPEPETVAFIRFSLFLTFEYTTSELWAFQATEVCVDGRCVSSNLLIQLTFLPGVTKMTKRIKRSHSPAAEVKNQTSTMAALNEFRVSVRHSLFVHKKLEGTASPLF